MAANIVKLRGLPWSTTEGEVIEFLKDVQVQNGSSGVHIVYNREGRPSGECFVECESSGDVERALQHNNEHLGKRYIEVSEGNPTEMSWVLNKSDSQCGNGDGVVRLRGLPFGCQKNDVASFFEGLQIVPFGITLTADVSGKCTGDAYVEFVNAETAEKALLKHKEKIGHRYIEIFRSSKDDIKICVGHDQSSYGGRFNQRPAPYPTQRSARGRGGMNMAPSGFNNMYNSSGPMRGGKSFRGRGMGGMPPSNNVMNSTTGHSIHMRGLPFEATASDVRNFFSNSHPVDIRILFESSGRAKGEADVDFATHQEAKDAMSKDKQNMGHRYIELFFEIGTCQ